MWPVFAVLIAINVLSVVVLALIAFSVGGASAQADTPSTVQREMSLGRVDPPQSGELPNAGKSAQRADVPPEYRSIEPAPSPWVVLPDGSIRFSRND
jgi:hypothetical protein